jgi:alpha-glucosidase
MELSPILNRNIMNKRFVILLSSILYFSFSISGQDNLISHQIGAVTQVRKVGHVVQVTTQDNRIVQLSVYLPAVVRVRIAPAGLPESPSFAVIRDTGRDFSKMADSGKEITLITDSLKIVVKKNPLRIDFYNARGQWLDGDAPSLGVEWQGSEVTSYRRLTDNEKFIGLGEKTGPLNRRGQSYVNWNTDHPGYGINDDPIYSTMPYFIGIHSGRVFGIFFDNSYRSFFDFGGSTDGSMYFLGADGGALNYYFFGASNVRNQIRDYTWLTGRMEMPPLWSLGYQQSRYSYMSQREVLDIAHRMRHDSIPCDALYCDIDYMNRYRIFTWNPDTYPRPEILTDSLKTMGIHLITIIDPGIKIDSDGYQPYLSGIRNNFFARYPDGVPYTGSVWAGRSHFPDFIREEVRRWWGGNFSSLVDKGVTGFWNDMNEPSAWGQDIPPLIEFGTEKNIMTLKEARNVYGMQMARATFEGTRLLLKGSRPFVLTRAAYSGIQRYSAMWTGDNNPTDEHMLLAYRMINSMGVTGEAFDGVDIGGFTGNPTPELMVRWMSLGAFTPMFRNHTAKENTAHEPWAWSIWDEGMMRQSIETRYRLLPYLYSVFYESTMTGMPINRTLAIDYTFNDEAYDRLFENEYLFGPSMLVAPVASTKQAEQVFLPAGQWYRFRSDEEYDGGKIIWAAAPLNDLPVFIKAGAIIPMQDVVQSTTNKGNGIMYLNVWYGGKPYTFTYYEDDGNTYDYLQGKFYSRQMDFDPFNREITLGNVEGSYATKFTSVELSLHGFPAGLHLSVNGSPVEAAQNGTLSTVVFNNENSKISIKW